MSWESLQRALQLAASILALPTVIAAFVVHLTKFGRKMAPYRRWIVGSLVAVAATFYVADVLARFGYFGEQTFDLGWPDAIRCTASMPENTGTSSITFYSMGEATARGNNFGNVMRYFHVGGRNIERDPKWPLAEKDRDIGLPPHQGYFSQQLWFKAKDKTLIRPSKDDWFKMDYVSQQYVIGWLPDIDCGGETMKAITDAGNAFAFARRMR